MSVTAEDIETSPEPNGRNNGMQESHDPGENESRKNSQTSHSNDSNNPANTNVNKKDGISPDHIVPLNENGISLKRINFFRHGDRYFKGTVWGISPQKFQNFESHLVELLNAPYTEDPQVIHSKYAFSSTVINSLENLNDSKNYYLGTKNIIQQLSPDSGFTEDSTPKLSAAPTKLSLASKDREFKIGTEVEEDPLAVQTTSIITEQQSANKFPPRTIVIIRNGYKPRRIVRFLLNQHTAKSYEQVLAEMGEAVRSESGTMKKVFGVDGVQVNSLADFYKEDVTTFIIYGPENPSPKDFELDSVERKWLSSTTLHMSAFSAYKMRSKGVLKGTVVDLPTSESIDFDGEDGFMKREVPSFKRGEEPSEFWQVYSLGQICHQTKCCTTHVGTLKSEKKESPEVLVKVLESIYHRELIDKELTIMRHLKNEHIIGLLDKVFKASDVLYVVMPYIRGFGLLEAVSKMNNYNEKNIAKIALQISAGVNYLHNEANLVHFNINYSSIMISEDTNQVVIGSFAKAALKESLKPSRIVFSDIQNSIPLFTAPEIVAKESEVTMSCDIYSIGVLLLVLLTGNKKPSVEKADLKQDLGPQAGYSELMQEIALKCLGYTSVYSEDKRPSADKRLSALQLTEALKVGSENNLWNEDLPLNALQSVAKWQEEDYVTPYVTQLLLNY